MQLTIGSTVKAYVPGDHQPLKRIGEVVQIVTREGRTCYVVRFCMGHLAVGKPLFCRIALPLSRLSIA